MFSYLSGLLTSAVEQFDKALEDTPAHQVFLLGAATVAAVAATYFVYNTAEKLNRAYRERHSSSLKQRLIDLAYKLTPKFSVVTKVIDTEIEKSLKSYREEIAKQRKDMALQDQMPKDPTKPVDILKQFGIQPKEYFTTVSENAKKHVVKTEDGKDSGALYAVYPGELLELLKEVYGATALTNTMHDKWPRINAMQAEVIRWCQKLFGGSDDGYGLITHGGSTSIIEALAAYVLLARAKGIKNPEIVVPSTKHAAFIKAAELTGARLITVPVDPRTGKVSAAEMEKYLSKNTAVIVGSAPSFMNGINDPIADLCELALKHKLPFHVDSCLGGFLTAFLDTSKNPMDFRVPGVTSISADLHKYGLCPKGTSVCLFSKDSPAVSVYAALNWPGGLYATAGTLDGSTSGARVAEIYSVLSYYGSDKYKEIAQKIVQLRGNIQKRVAQLADIQIYGEPQWSVLGFCSQTLNPHEIAAELDKKGWKLNFLQNPAGFHLCLTQVHTLVDDFENKFIKDLTDAIAIVKAYPKKHAKSSVVKTYGIMEMMPTALQEVICDRYQRARLAFKATCTHLGLFKTTPPAEQPASATQGVTCK